MMTQMQTGQKDTMVDGATAIALQHTLAVSIRKRQESKREKKKEKKRDRERVCVRVCGWV